MWKAVSFSPLHPRLHWGSAVGHALRMQRMQIWETDAGPQAQRGKLPGQGVRWKVTDCRTGRTFGRRGRGVEGRAGSPGEKVLEQL